AVAFRVDVAQRSISQLLLSDSRQPRSRVGHAGRNLAAPLLFAGVCENGLNPVLVIQIPPNRLTNAVFEAVSRNPAELPLDLCRVNGVTPVVTGPVFDEGDELARLSS